MFETSATALCGTTSNSNIMQGSAATNQSAARTAKGVRARFLAARLAAIAWNNLKLETTMLTWVKSPPRHSSQMFASWSGLYKVNKNSEKPDIHGKPSRTAQRMTET